ncbi:MAG: ATP synthase F0 subunit A [Planctomycetota bacterium]|nr:MAG: ATP synthase F0 subunit A [Planctomycetota bacterium]
MLLLAADNPLTHVVDHALIRNPDAPAPFQTILSVHMVTLALASALLVWLMLSVARAARQGKASEGPDRYITRGRLAQGVEAMCLYLRDEVVKPQLGDKTDRYIGFLWTLFFFILVNNLLGLVPLLDLQGILGVLLGKEHLAFVGGTATGDIAVTAALALIAFVVIQVTGLRTLGLKGWASHLTAGAPAYLWPIMVPVEIMSMFIKPFALAVRLFANMVAGHTLLATLMLFTKMGLEGVGLFSGGAISLVSIASALPIMLLEVLVAFIQAFIFFILTTVFIAQLAHEHHHEDHEEPALAAA